MSLGGPSDSTTLRNAVAYAYEHGVTIVCSAGNEYLIGNQINYPAAYDQYCIAVGATDYSNNRAPYSNTGSYIDLVAPGGNLDLDENNDSYGDGILQQTFGTGPKDWGYWFYEGTSMAAPHVTATAGLLASQGITNPDLIRQILQETAHDLGPAGWDPEYGYGIIDAYAALQYCDILGDFNHDCVVNIEDLAILISFWLQNEPPVDIAPSNPDNIINFLDFAEMAHDWNR